MGGPGNGNGNGNGNGVTQGWPVWAKIAMWLGVPAVFAFWLMWTETNTLLEIQKNQIIVSAQIGNVADRIKEHNEEAGRSLEVLRTICRRVGRDRYEQERC